MASELSFTVWLTIGVSLLSTLVLIPIGIPLAWRGIIAGGILAFARALGEFGATIMVAGNIPGETSTLALGIYHNVQLGEDRQALLLATISLLIALIALLTSEWLLRSSKKGRS